MTKKSIEQRDSLVEKIKNCEKLTEKELQNIELALSVYYSYDDVLNECLNITDDNEFELKYKCK